MRPVHLSMELVHLSTTEVSSGFHHPVTLDADDCLERSTR